MKRYNISDITNLGFPSLEEIGINAVHESYQFLSKNYVENVLQAAKDSEGKKDIEESKNKRRNSYKADKFLKPHELRRTNSCKNNILNSDSERKANKGSRRNSGRFLNTPYKDNAKVNSLNIFPFIFPANRSRRESNVSLASIGETEQLSLKFTKNFAISTPEKLEDDIDATFSSNMTDFDLNGEVDEDSTLYPKSRAGIELMKIRIIKHF